MSEKYGIRKNPNVISKCTLTNKYVTVRILHIAEIVSTLGVCAWAVYGEIKHCAAVKVIELPCVSYK